MFNHRWINTNGISTTCSELTSKLTDSITSKNTSFFLYLIPSDLQDTAFVTAIGIRGWISNLCPS